MNQEHSSLNTEGDGREVTFPTHSSYTLKIIGTLRILSEVGTIEIERIIIGV